VKAKPGDRVYLFFSGHGITVSGGDSYFLAYNLASDFSVENIEEAGTEPLYQLKTNTIRPLTNRKVQVVLILDACRSHLEDSLRSVTVKTFDPDLNSAELNAGDIMFLSSSNGQVSEETSKSGIRHGIFTYYLLQGLYGMADNGRNHDGLITVNKLNTYVTKMVSDYTNEVQIPRIIYKGSDNPVLSKVDSGLLALQLSQNKEQMIAQSAVVKKEEMIAQSAIVRRDRPKGLPPYPDSTSMYYDLFFARLNAGRVWDDDGALHYFKLLEHASKDSNLIRDAVLNLSSVLVDSGQAIINSYIKPDPAAFKKQKHNYYRSFKTGAKIFDTLYKINKKYFPGDKENDDYLQQYYFMIGSYDASTNRRLEYLYKAYQLDTSDTYILNSIDEELNQQRKRELALKNQEKVVKKYPNWYFAYNNMGIILYDSKKYSEALSWFEKALKIDSLWPFAWVNIGNYYIDVSRQYEIAKDYYLKAISLDSTYALPWSNLDLLYRKTKNYTKAIESAKNAVELNPMVMYYWNRLGQDYDAVKKYHEAFECYERSLALDSTYTDTWNCLGLLYDHRKNRDSAIECFKREISIDSASTDGWSNLGRMYGKSKKYDKAMECYQKELFLDSTISRGWYDVGDVYLDLKKYDTAMHYYQKGLFIDSIDPYGWVALGNVYYNQGKDSAALGYYESGLKTFQNNSTLLEYTGDVYSRMHKDKEAIDHYKKMLEIDTLDIRGWNSMGRFFLNRNMYDSAIVYFKKTFNIDSSDYEALKGLGLISDNKKDYEQSIKYYLKAVSLDPGNADLLSYLGYAYTYNKDYSAGIDCFLKEISLDTTSADGYYNMACAYSLKGDAQQGFKYLELAFQKGFSNYEHVKKDEDLNNLRKTGSFNNLLGKYFEQEKSGN